MDPVPTIVVLDDEQSVVSAVERLLHAEGLQTRGWTSARAFLAEHDPAAPGCLVVDLIMPEMNGLEVQRQLAMQGDARPVVIITGRGDMSVVVEGMRAGAVTFLEKPVRGEVLLEAVGEALERDAIKRAVNAERHRVNEMLKSLTARERQVLELVARGLLNKQIAGELGLAEKTVKAHRGRVMRKMSVRSVVALLRALMRCDALSSQPSENVTPWSGQTSTSRSSGHPTPRPERHEAFHQFDDVSCEYGASPTRARPLLQSPRLRENS